MKSHSFIGKVPIMCKVKIPTMLLPLVTFLREDLRNKHKTLQKTFFKQTQPSINLTQMATSTNPPVLMFNILITIIMMRSSRCLATEFRPHPAGRNLPTRIITWCITMTQQFEKWTIVSDTKCLRVITKSFFKISFPKTPNIYRIGIQKISDI